jgi:hypothetical protein
VVKDGVSASARSLVRASAALLALFVLFTGLGMALVALLSATGRHDVLERFARAFGLLLSWRMAPGQPVVTALLIFLGNTLACGFVALAGPLAAAGELRLRSARGLLDRFLRVAYGQRGVVSRLCPALAGAPVDAPRSGFAVAALVPVFSLAVNGLYSGLALGIALTMLPASAVLGVAWYAPLECAALALSGALSLRFACSGRATSLAGLRAEAVSAYALGPSLTVIGLLALSALLEASVIASSG